jgi:hypothetical protein
VDDGSDHFLPVSKLGSSVDQSGQLSRTVLNLQQGDLTGPMASRLAGLHTCKFSGKQGATSDKGKERPSKWNQYPEKWNKDKEETGNRRGAGEKACDH